MKTNNYTSGVMPPMKPTDKNYPAFTRDETVIWQPCKATMAFITLTEILNAFKRQTNNNRRDNENTNTNITI